MSATQTKKIEIIPSATSKINEVDFDNLSFGAVFTDHLFECDFINGEWQTPTVKPYAPFLVDPSTRVFHYGQAIFEGMKAYKDEQDAIWLFRPDENYKRFNKSAVRMAMPEVPEDIFMNGLKEVETILQSQSVLIKNNKLNQEQELLLDKLLFRIKAVKKAKRNKYVLMNAPNEKLNEIIALLPGMRSPTVLPLAEGGWSSVHSVLSEDEFWEKIEQLKAAGAEGILVVPIEKMVM